MTRVTILAALLIGVSAATASEPKREEWGIAVAFRCCHIWGLHDLSDGPLATNQMLGTFNGHGTVDVDSGSGPTMDNALDGWRLLK